MRSALNAPRRTPAPPLSFPLTPHTAAVHHTLRLALALLPAVAACQPKGGAADPAPLAAPVRPLSMLVSQQVVVAPVNSLREVDALGWTGQIPRSREFMRAFDEALETELGARGLKTRWVYPAALERAARSNPSHAVDPYSIAAAPLRSAGAVAGARLADPLANQLRTMIALQESARAVLLPVELRFEPAPGQGGLAVLRIAMVDGRLGEIRWIGDVRSDPSLTFSRELLTSLAAHTADLITAR